MNEPNRDGVQEVQLLAPLPPGRDETRLFQQPEMFHDAEASHRQPLLESAQGLSVFLEQFVEQLSTSRIRERFEHIIHGQKNT